MQGRARTRSGEPERRSVRRRPQVHSVPLVLRIGHAAPDGHGFVPDPSDLITKMCATD